MRLASEASERAGFPWKFMGTKQMPIAMITSYRRKLTCYCEEEPCCCRLLTLIDA